MNATILLCFALAGGLVAWGLTAAVRRYALASQLLDLPNERSSHQVATPRGGGVAIVTSFLALTVIAWLLGMIDARFFAAIVGAGTLVSVLGFVDDRSHLPARWRFLGHAAAAAWILAWMGGIPPVPVFGTRIDLGIAGLVVAGAYLVWSTNLFNFMDGIDGIASIEAITVMVAAGVLWMLYAPGSGGPVPILLAACVGGFLVWNYPPARIFMGDAGSGFLGIMVGLLSLWCGHILPHLFWSWFILYGVFMVDATVTLVRRVNRRQPFYQAHRSHAYQYASRRLRSHRNVSLAIGAINLAWLLPLAWLVAEGRLDGVAGVVIAYAPLAWLAFKFKAGDAAAQDGAATPHRS